jgi:DNA gyrase/topoisomerase IV subunit B
MKRLKGPEVTRFKGLGEISPGEFKRFISTDMHLTAVDVPSMGLVHKTLEFFMGKNTPARKTFIVKNLDPAVI